VTVQNGSPKSAALDHMADVVICNRPRCSPLWRVFFRRVSEMAASPIAAERAASTLCLKRIILSMLALSGGSQGSAATVATSESGSGGDREVVSGIVGDGEGYLSDADLEELLLRAVAQIFNARGAFPDTRFACLDIVHHVLQVCILCTHLCLFKIPGVFSPARCHVSLRTDSFMDDQTLCLSYCTITYK
jgi:hypothetical protein